MPDKIKKQNQHTAMINTIQLSNTQLATSTATIYQYGDLYRDM